MLNSIMLLTTGVGRGESKPACCVQISFEILTHSISFFPHLQGTRENKGYKKENITTLFISRAEFVCGRVIFLFSFFFFSFFSPSLCNTNKRKRCLYAGTDIVCMKYER